MVIDKTSFNPFVNQFVNLNGFLIFSGVEKGCIGKKWVKLLSLFELF